MARSHEPHSSKPRGENFRRGSQKTKSKPGFAARRLAVEALAGVLSHGRPLEEAFETASSHDKLKDLEPRDRAFARLIVMTVLRRKGELKKVLDTFLTRDLPNRSGRLSEILLSASAQLLMLDTPAHAAISLAVDQCRTDRDGQHFAGLANAVLRRVAAEGPAILAASDAIALNTPAWLLTRWRQHYGDDVATKIAKCSLIEAPLDISTKSDQAGWAQRLDGTVLPTGSVRRASGGRVEDLTGFAEGEWWVQDAAAALPARLLGDVSGKTVVDICAAPGGKTAELANAGARVTAVDVSAVRIKRLEENMRRLKLDAEIVEADVTSWAPDKLFDAVLLDAPCSATGTIRRHPDILHLKRAGDIATLAKVQERFSDAAAKLVKPGGLFVYCTCSLEPEEGELQLHRFLERHPEFARVPLKPGEFGIVAECITPNGDLRTLPCHMDELETMPGGMDGFFASRVQRVSR